MSREPDAKVWQELLHLRSLTETTGVLHDAQKFQLQFWGPILITHGRNFEVGVQLPWTEGEGQDAKYHDVRVVEFRVLATVGRPPKDLAGRLKALDQWVKRLLGEKFVVRVIVRGKLIFEGKGKSPKKKTK